MRRFEPGDIPAIDVELHESRAAANLEMKLCVSCQACTPHAHFRRARQMAVAQYLAIRLVDFDDFELGLVLGFGGWLAVREEASHVHQQSEAQESNRAEPFQDTNPFP